MKARTDEGLDALLAFLAGAAAGGAAAGWLAAQEARGSGGLPGPASLDAARGVGATEASLGRIHALLGEIRALMRPKEGAGRAETPGAAAPDTLASRAPGGGRGSSGEDRSEGSRPGREAWRRPDRIGYVGPAMKAPARDAGAFMAGGLAVAGAAAAWALARKDAAPAALSTAGGFLLAMAWALWRSGGSREGNARKARPRWSAVPVLGRAGSGRRAIP